MNISLKYRFSRSVDLLSAVNIGQEPLGVSQATGICDNRALRIDDDGNPVYGAPDIAFSITQTAVLTVTTSQLFTAEWSVRKTSIVWSTLDTEPQTSPPSKQNRMKLSLLTSHASVCNTTMVGFESGDTKERGY
ncbi:collagen alpha-1(XI) chain [Trichonephila clavipes]|nr:collagen alpha-1(XI) chain [Trichonephila clavipes]